MITNQSLKLIAPRKKAGRLNVALDLLIDHFLKEECFDNKITSKIPVIDPPIIQSTLADDTEGKKEEWEEDSKNGIGQRGISD